MTIVFLYETMHTITLYSPNTFKLIQKKREYTKSLVSSLVSRFEQTNHEGYKGLSLQSLPMYVNHISPQFIVIPLNHCEFEN